MDIMVPIAFCSLNYRARYLNNSFLNLTIVCLEKAPAHDVIMKPALIRSIPHIRSNGVSDRKPR